MDQRSTVVVFLITISAIHDVVDAASYRYLGCFQDVNSINRDLKGRDLMLTDLTPDSCAQQCQPVGYPYVGLQFGKRCFCGNNFGSHGASVDCNTTCNFQYCGGYLANDVYYSLDRGVSSGRRFVYHSTAMTFKDARMECVAGNGDLPSVENDDVLNDVIGNVTSTAIPSNGTSATAIWIGLRQRQTAGPLEWTDENTIPYNMHYYDFDQYWTTGESFLEACVQVTIATKKWKTVSCDISLPFVCLQLPPPPVPTELSITAAEPIEETEDGTMNLALLIVMPIFLACYAGSCIAYMVYKIYRHLRHKPIKSEPVNLNTVETPPPTAPRRMPGAFPAYLHAPGQPLPAPFKPDRMHPRAQPFSLPAVKSPPRYNKPAEHDAEPPATSKAGDAGLNDDGDNGGLTISEILMKKLASKPGNTQP